MLRIKIFNYLVQFITHYHHPIKQLYFQQLILTNKKVPKSLAYRLFGYSLDDISREYWPPDLLAVYFSEKFNKTDEYPFYRRLKNRVLK